MQRTLINKLCCPFDKEDLALKVFVQDTDENISEGMLTCAHCKRYFPIVYGVPMMTPDEYRQFGLEAPLLARWKNYVEVAEMAGFRLPDRTDKEEQRML